MALYKVLFLALCGVASLVTRCLAVAASSSELEKAIAATFPEASAHAYKFATPDLNSDSIPDAIVLLSDLNYCGSGGCTLLVFKGTAGGFQLVSESTVSHEPIYMLLETRNGWHSLAVTVSGGGLPMSQALMRFDGKAYPLNPSVQPFLDARDLKLAKRLELR